MTVLVTIVAIIIVVGGLAVWYDHRAKRRGWRTSVSTQRVERHQGEVAARDRVIGREAEPDAPSQPDQS
jgi:hypothetical protein